MPLSRFIACLAAAAALCACGSEASGGGRTSHTPSATCRFTSDSVRPAGSVEIRPPGRAPRHITAASQLPCQSVLTVAFGKADATFVTSSRDTICQLRRNAGSSIHAAILTRSPVAAHYLFRLAVGHAGCTFQHPFKRVSLCHIGTMSALGVASATAQCHPDPIFQVAVEAGLVLVTDAAGQTVLGAGQELTFDSATNKPTMGTALFSAEDRAVFGAQVNEMGLTPIPQTITFTSSAPAASKPGATYAVSATGGQSGNPVLLTIDPSSAKICSIAGITLDFTSAGARSGGTVTFTSAGTCIIDANQAANALYQAAPQQQQSIRVA
jgi:hypothetical protein